ncbi:MAG: hypothetical protein K0R72_701 [Clostridia bacterium]|jgi:hypothetical protein|nr:hypothetical protein [Clostridia bacterium]
MENQIFKETIGGLVITHNNGILLDVDTTDEYKKIKITNSQSILQRIDEFKSRGAAVVKKELINCWSEMIDDAFQDDDKINYNGSIIVACLECMELLTQGKTVEDSYMPIDIQNSDKPAIHCNMILSGWQNNTATTIVATYHERGQEFCYYRNWYVKR